MGSCPKGLSREEEKSIYIFAVSFQSESKNLQQPMDSMQHKSVLFLWPLKHNLKFYQLLPLLLLSLVKAKQQCLLAKLMLICITANTPFSKNLLVPDCYLLNKLNSYHLLFLTSFICTIVQHKKGTKIKTD